MKHAGGWLEYIVMLIEFISSAILLIGFVKACVRFTHTQVQKMNVRERSEILSHIRLQLGTYILLGLDFYIVSDIIYSMIRPALNELINLALIVVLRTTIGYFLSREINEIEAPRYTQKNQMQ